jgi:hypothetical protein
MLREKIIRELEAIPDEHLADLYEVIRDFRGRVERPTSGHRKPGLLPGKLGDAFFDPLPEDELRRWG